MARGKYLIIWDIKRDVDPSERVKIYRRLKTAIRRSTKDGAEIKWVQRSAILVASKEHALRVAAALERPGVRLNIYKIAGELR